MGQTTSSTSIQLFWNETFGSLVPTYILTYTVNKLSGSSPSEIFVNQSLMMACGIMGGMEQFDCSYSLEDLIPFTEYNFSLVAVYDDGGSSSPVLATAVTFEERECCYYT